MAKKTYTAKEKKAYHMGRAYATAKAGKRVKISDEKQKQSFRNGVNAVRGKGVTRKGKVPKGKLLPCGRKRRDCRCGEREKVRL